jgi:D-cysteine desulfhydrase family pyridoxal phosphate-dependent enzyme
MSQLETWVRSAMIDSARASRITLATTPTPLQQAHRLGARLGLDQLWIKRDDLTGLAMGGNKARKLEFLLSDALAQGSDVVLTTGGPQSNHCRTTAAAARMCGLDAELVFMGREVSAVQGNMVLDHLFGASWTFVADDAAAEAWIERRVGELRDQGRRPYVIPGGGSNGRGTLGYVSAAEEIAQQCRANQVEPQAIFCAAGSCGTLAGLTLGADIVGLNARLIGVSVSRAVADRVGRTVELMRAAAGLLGTPLPGRRPEVRNEQVGEGYGLPTEASREALNLMARTEGILLDPVYTAKAFAALVGMARKAELDPSRPVVFVHTGGTPALFADQELYWG